MLFTSELFRFSAVFPAEPKFTEFPSYSGLRGGAYSAAEIRESEGRGVGITVWELAHELPPSLIPSSLESRVESVKEQHPDATITETPASFQGRPAVDLHIVSDDLEVWRRFTVVRNLSLSFNTTGVGGAQPNLDDWQRLMDSFRTTAAS